MLACPKGLDFFVCYWTIFSVRLPFSKKNPKNTNCLGVRAFQSCHGVWPYLWVVLRVFSILAHALFCDLINWKEKGFTGQLSGWYCTFEWGLFCYLGHIWNKMTNIIVKLFCWPSVPMLWEEILRKILKLNNQNSVIFLC